MKLRNKKTGEIRELPDGFFCGNNLKKICEEWEDYKEPKGYWYIDYDGRIHKEDYAIEEEYKDMLEIGNYFETEEEAEKAVEKLKAWKRLKDKGFDLEAVVEPFFCLDIYMSSKSQRYQELKEDLIIVFGGDNESSN